MATGFDDTIGTGATGGIDIASVRERLDGLQADARRRAEETQQLAQRLESISATASDDARVVTVTVDSAGHVTDLVFSDRVRGRQPDWLGQTVMAVIKAARAKLAEQTREIVEDTVGGESSTGRAVLSRYADDEAAP
ncbi:YbaB/EbfC family nucleoid-associated protein [Glycomyces paridis]|uniref:YbaB/EbfC family nucleoid-associated protein n=1 Tax=Glycomyces paridis TaxID=2126555 RepID=A0A4S8PHW9_9ACTN|nr:YbaB/EbfC family nucleoid-associated protein [Glycomyces paridis]THV30170.1 YbaB/EbfC family nucleoid-associated protein [Glycomyces paridis]